MEYHKTAIKRFPRLAQPETAENRFWKKFKSLRVFQDYTAVQSVHFAPSKPHTWAVCSGSKLKIYESTTREPRKISRFDGTVYTAAFRSDGNLLVAGEHSGAVQVFNVSNRLALRRLQGHTRPVRVANFLSSNTHCFSAGDDGTVRVWDVVAEAESATFKGHGDYVRAGAPSQSNDNLFITGSYDHRVQMWDVRTNESAMSIDHGDPVEAVLMFPGGSTFISAGGNKIKVWDALNAGRCLATVSNHQKTVTALAFDGTAKRLLSGSIDRQLKVYDIADYSVVHSIKYPSPILGIGVSPDDTHLAVGMSSGALSVRRRILSDKAKKVEQAEKRQPRAGTYRFFARGHAHKANEFDFQVIEATQKKQKLTAYDRLLKQFKYAEALDTALEGHQPVVVISVLHELAQRDGLKTALSGRDDVTLKPVLGFVCTHITNPRYTSPLLSIAELLLNMYAQVIGLSPAIDELFVKLQRKLQVEVNFQKSLIELQGALEMVFAGSQAT